ncbi:MAG: IclR family transcriptional regulator [bacterium]
MEDGGRKISTTEKGTKTARTLEKGLTILGLFDSEHPAWTISGLSRATGMPMPTTLRLTRTLQKSGYLSRNPQTRSYELGSAIYRAAMVPRSHSELVRVARPHLERLVELTTESAGLGVWERGEANIIDMVLTPRSFKPTNQAGRTIPGLASSCGRIAVAFGPEHVLEAALAREHPKLTEHTVTDPAKLREEIERIRREHVSFGIETISIGTCAVSAPVFDSDGRVVASVAVVAPTERFGTVERRAHAEVLQREATLLSHELGYADGQDPVTEPPRP